MNDVPVPVTILFEVDIVTVPVVCADALTAYTYSPCLNAPLIVLTDKNSISGFFNVAAPDPVENSHLYKVNLRSSSRLASQVDALVDKNKLPS